MEVKVNIIDTLFTTIPKNTVVASYTIDEDSVDLTMLNDQYSFNTTNKTILTSSNVTSNNLKAINFTARNWVSGEQVEINDMYPRVVSKLQNKFNKPNTIYKVTKDLDLNHCVLTIPEGCTLQFDGGSISNGYIEGSILNDVIDLNKIRVNDLGIFFSYFELRDGQTLILEKNKVYISSTDININASNISINGNGATIQSTNTTQLSNIIKVSPQITAYSGLNINATVGSTTVSLGNIASSIQIGDHIQIRDSANRLNLNYHNGIYAIVVDKKDNTITLDIPYNSDIITNIEVYKPLYNVKIFDLTLGFNDSHGQRGIRLVKCRNSEIYNIKADGLGNLSGIYIDDCYYTKVHDCVLSKFFDIDRIVNMNGYGIGASGRDIEIYNNNVYDCRHCYAGDSRDYTSFIHIHDNTASYSYNTYAELNGIQPVIYAGMYDLHGNNKGIIENNIGTTTLLESGKWYGITVRESDVIIRNNTIENNSNTFEGLAIILSELAYNNILIENNKITGRVVIGSVVTNLQLINNIFNDSFIDFSTISDNTEKSINILYNKFYINNATRTTPIIQGKEQNYNYNIQGNIFIDEYNISSSVINISALASSVYIDNNLFILNNKTSANVIIFPSSQITTFDLKSTISNNKFIVPNLPQTVDITNYWRGKYFSNYDSRLDSVVRNINILENTSQLPALGRTILEGTLFLCRDTHKIYVYNYNRYSGLDGRLMDVPFATNYANVSTVLSSLDSYKDVGLTLYITDRKQFVTYNGTTFIRTDGYEYNSTTVRIPSQLSEIEVSNCIYRIIYNFDLNGETLTLPSNCTLDFQGGSFSNGTIIGSNTTVLPNGYKIQNVSLEGSFKYPDGVNAVSSDGLCLNNVYDILDKQNLATTEINNYVVKDDDYTILSQFDTLKNVNAVDGSFIGFPTSVIYNNLLYCFYYKANTHESTPGIQENIYYKYSSDKGITWSEEKEWVLPSSDSNGTYRSYRTAYVVPFGSNLLFGIFCTTTTSSAIGGSFTLVCEATISEAHDITILNQIKTPIVGASGSLVYNYTDATITNSMIIGGNIIQVGSNYLMACYTSNRNNYVFSFDGNFTDNTHITQLDVISSEQFDYTEHAFIKFSDTNFYIAFREDARRENTPIFKYDTSTSKFELFTYIDNVAYDGLDAIILDDNTAMIAGRDARNYFTPTRFALMNSSGKVFISNAKYYGDVLGRDCGYCSLQIIEDTLINIFYLKRSQPNYNYGVVSRRIPVKTLTNLIFY